MSTPTLPAAARARTRPPSGPVPRPRFRRRWLLVVTAGEAVGFLVPVLAVLSGAADLPGAAGLAVVVAAGAAEGAVLGAAQAAVLAGEVPGLSRRDWIVRTAAAAAVAWVIGMGPSTWAEGVLDGPVALQVVLAVPAAGVLLGSIGLAQWTVLRRHVPRAGRWVAWTAAGWLAGLAVFTAFTAPLWQPGQAPALVAAIGVLGGLVMALSMAAVTGRGAVLLLRGTTGAPVARAGAGAPDHGDDGPAPWTLLAAEVAARAGVDPRPACPTPRRRLGWPPMGPTRWPPPRPCRCCDPSSTSYGTPSCWSCSPRPC